MSDIYKNREAMPAGDNNSPKGRRKHRSASVRAFDDHSRKRRSKNTGLRRVLHLSRKTDNEKYFWGTTAAVIVILLVIIALWQFVVMERLVQSEEKESDYNPSRSLIRGESASE